MLIYLSGPMTGMDRGAMTNWREDAKTCAPHHTWLDPTRASNLVSEEIGCFTRDYNDVKRSDLVLVNLRQECKDISIGTMFEIAWAYEMRKPIILIVNPDTSHKLYQTHPFLKDCTPFRTPYLYLALCLIDEIGGTDV